MTPQARVAAAIEIIDRMIVAARDGGAAGDAILAADLKARRYAGSGDRRAIRDLVWAAVRAHGSVPSSGRAALVSLADGDPMLAGLFDGSPHAPAPIRADEPRGPGPLLPSWLTQAAHPAFDGQLGAQRQERASLIVRLNSSHPDAIRAFDTAFPDVARIDHLPMARVFAGWTDLSRHPLHLAGSFEIQDAASQMACALVAEIAADTAQPAPLIIDYCAGGGGKTLGIAAALPGARLVACDTDRRRLGNLAPRAARAGLTGIETRLLDGGREADALRDLIGQARVVLVDAPCSGTGTWRRAPDLAWRMTPARLAAMARRQAMIVRAAMPLVAPGGSLVYAVCSVTSAETDAVVSETLRDAPGWRIGRVRLAGDRGTETASGRLLTPRADGTDGFYLARLVRC